MSQTRRRFAHSLKQLMTRRGVNQQVLAQRSGISQSLISRYLSADERTVAPTLDSLVKLALALQCGLDELTGFIPPPIEDQSSELPERELAACARAVNTLPEDHWLRVYIRQEWLNDRD